VAIVLKSGSLNSLEPSGPVQACNGNDLPLPGITLPIVCKVQEVVSHAEASKKAERVRKYVLRKIFGVQKKEVIGGSRHQHDVERNDLYPSPNAIRVMKPRRMRWEGHVAQMRERRGVYWALVGKPERKRPFGRPRCRWEDNIKMDLQEVGCGGMDWIELV